MSGRDSSPDWSATSLQTCRRREVLAALAATGAVSLAGCSSDDDGDGSNTGDSSSGDDNGSPGSNGGSDDGSGTGDDGSGSNGSDDGSDNGGSDDGSDDGGSDDGPCPTGSFTYVTQEYSTRSGTTVGSFEVPESARVEIPDSSFQVGGSVILEYADGSFDSLGWTVQFTQDFEGNEQTVDDEVEAVRGLENQTVELTGSYNVASGGRVIATSEDTFPGSVYVILPHPDGVLRVMLGTPNPATCPDAAERVLTRMIESQRAI